MSSKISGFSDFYYNLKEDLNSPSFNQNEVFNLVKENMVKIASLNGISGGLSFKSDGTIAVDNWEKSKSVRSFIKDHVVKYSSYSEDMRNLKVFTAFLNNLVESRTFDNQKLHLLDKMIEQTKQGLQKLKEKNPLEKDLIAKSLKKLENTKKSVNTLISKSENHTTLTAQIKGYVTYLRKQTMKIEEKVSLVQARLNDLTNPIIGEIDLKDLNQKMLDAKKRINEINKQAQGANISDKELAALMKEKSILQKNVASTQELIEVHPQRIFQVEPYKSYQTFVSELDCYPHTEDKNVLLMALILHEPSNTELGQLKLTLDSNKNFEISKRELKTIQRQAIQQSKFFEGAPALIANRKLAKKMDFEKSPIKSRSVHVTKLATKLITMGGLAALSFAVPSASFSLLMIPSLAKSGYQDLKNAWNNKEIEEKELILAGMKDLVNEIKSNPEQLAEDLKKLKEGGESTKEVVLLVSSLANAIKAHGADKVLKGILSGHLPVEETEMPQE